MKSFYYSMGAFETKMYSKAMERWDNFLGSWSPLER
jgi:cytochrome c-type biogenesis protein CcmH/NrfG